MKYSKTLNSRKWFYGRYVMKKRLGLYSGNFEQYCKMINQKIKSWSTEIK